MRYVNEQEQEHLDHVAGSASEFQNCYEEARVRSSDEQSKVRGIIHRMVNEGLFVIVCSSPDYCKVTDAICGEHLSIRGAYGDRGAANRSLAAMHEAGRFDPEDSTYVYPFELPPAPEMICDDENVPF